MSILGLQKKTKTKQNSTLWSGLWVWYLHSIGRKKNFFKTQRDKQKDKMIVVNLSPAAAPREAGRPGAAPKTSMQRLTEPAKEPDAAVRDRKNGLRVGVCFLWLASAASVTPFSRFISKIWYEEFQENVCAKGGKAASLSELLSQVHQMFVPVAVFCILSLCSHLLDIETMLRRS